MIVYHVLKKDMMELDRSKLVGLGVGMTVFMVVLEVLGVLGFPHEPKPSIIIYYILISCVLVCSVVFTSYNFRQSRIESVIV